MIDVVSEFLRKVKELDAKVDLKKKNAKKKTCRIYLFRHAQTYYNKRHIFTGHKDSKLTPFGEKQARKVARLLKDKEFDIAVHSRLSRSKDTLKAVLNFHPECMLKVEDDRMIERSYGDLQGHTHTWYLSLHGEEALHKVRRDYATRPPKGESIKDVDKRVKAFIKDLLIIIRTYKVDVAISAHGNSMRPFRRYFERLTVEEMMKLENPWDDYFEYKVKV